MNYKLDFSITEDIDEIFDSLHVEKINRVRSNINIIKNKKSLDINITATDPTALRATFDGIIKLIIVYKKMKGLK